MNAKQKLHQAQLTQWAARISDQKASGLTIRQWCDQNHISFHKYNYWKHLLKEEVVDQMLPEIVPLSVPAVSPSAGKALPQSTQPVSGSVRTNCANRTNCTNTRVCIDGIAFEFEPSVSEEFLRTVIRAVRYA